MPTVTVKIRNTEYALACGAGEEGLLQGLASALDQRLGSLESPGKGSDIRLLVMTALMMEGELQDLKEKLVSHGINEASNHNNPGLEINNLAIRLENIASELNRV